MIFETYLSFKYLFCKRKEKFISLIAILSIGGVTISVMTLIVVIAVMSGFGESLKEKIAGINPQVVVSSYGIVENYIDLEKKLKKIPHVKYVYPYVEGQAIMNEGSRVYGIFIKGLPPDKSEYNIVKKYLKKGKLPLKRGEAVLGIELARRSGVSIGDYIKIISPAIASGGTTPVLNFKVIGFFKTEMFEYDNSLIFLNLRDAQILFGFDENQVHGLGINTDDIENAYIVKKKVMDILPDGYYAKSWMDINKNLFAALKTEKNVMFILLTLAVLVAATNIVSTLVMVVMEKTREIGILKAIGMTNFSIMKLFVIEGALIGFIGSSLGLILGILFVKWLDKIESFVSKVTGFEVFPREIYYFDKIPAVIEWHDIFVITLSAFFISVLAALYPSWKASRLSPVEAIRYE